MDLNEHITKSQEQHVKLPKSNDNVIGDMFSNEPMMITKPARRVYYKLRPKTRDSLIV